VFAARSARAAWLGLVIAAVLLSLLAWMLGPAPMAPA
jgi:hypothetical protein